MDREPGPESGKNVAVALGSWGDMRKPQPGSRGARRPSTRSNITTCSARSSRSLEGQGGDRAGRSGASSQGCGRPAARPAPPDRPAFDKDRRSRNVIAFSIWGTDIRYLNGAVTNAIVARYLYPGWTARFYTDRSTPRGFLDELKRNGAEVIVIDDLDASRFGLFWRFLVEDDPDVDLYLVRDADPVINVKERWAVADWLQSGKAFHVMRDNPQHSELMLAGLWGAHRGNSARCASESRAPSPRAELGNYINHDQHFLRAEIWPIARNSVKIHDDYFDFMSPTRFSPAFRLPRPLHVGQNDWVNFQDLNARPRTQRLCGPPARVMASPPAARGKLIGRASPCQPPCRTDLGPARSRRRLRAAGRNGCGADRRDLVRGRGRRALLVKYLFTSERLSIQVHPDDAAARARGHARGKDEAWYVLSAEPGAVIGLGLTHEVSREALREAALDGSIEHLLDWRPVGAGEAFYSPAGTVHAIGGGLSLIEIQQNLDLTYRLYDYGRPRELHLDEGVAVADPAPWPPFAPVHDGARTILAAGHAFVLERWTLAGGAAATLPEGSVLVPLAAGGTIDGETLEAGTVWAAEGPVTLGGPPTCSSPIRAKRLRMSISRID